jgi:catechol 2,3-dioxygenase-like lactoylglutathione lyase family enzyme
VIGPIDGIDHAILGTGDLEAARALWTRLGFTITPRGRHKGWGTGNYCIMLEHDYLELLGMVDPAGFDNGLGAMLAGQGDGLLGFALAADDADKAAAWLASRGRPHARRDLGRLLELPEGAIELKFALAMIRCRWPTPTSACSVSARPCPPTTRSRCAGAGVPGSSCSPSRTT